MELRLEEVEAREMKSPEKLGKFEFSIFGSGVAGRGRPYWDEGGRRTVKVGGGTIFFDFVRLKDGSGGRTDNFCLKRTEADAGRGSSSVSRTDLDYGQAKFLKKRTKADEDRPARPVLGRKQTYFGLVEV